MDLKSMTLQEMQEYMESIGEKKFRAKQIYEWFHKHLALSLDEMNNVPKKLKEKNEEKRCCVLTDGTINDDRCFVRLWGK